MLNLRRYGLLLLLTACSTPTDSGNQSRIVTFGDSNTDGGWKGATLVANSYLEPENPAPASAPNNAYTLAGMLDARGIPAVNHGINGTRSGGGRIASGAPNALESIGGVTRFEAEVLGLGFPWDGGGPHPIPRLQAFQPGACDYVYVSIGTNDGRAANTVTNLRWMMTRWVAAGHAPRHFIVTTLAPARVGTWVNRAIPKANNQIRQLAFKGDVMLIDLAQFTSTDDGGTWRSESLHVGDGVHYAEVVRTWIADRVSDYVRTQGCQ